MKSLKRRAIREFIKRHPLGSFFALSYIWAWSFWSHLVVSTTPGSFFQGVPSPTFLVLALVGGFGPTVAGFIVARITQGKEGIQALIGQLKQWRANLSWYVIVLFLVPLVILATTGIHQLLGIPVQFGDIVSRAALGIIWPIFAAFGEEFGWRGFALPKLQSTRTALRSSLIIGLAWGMWHLPVDFLVLRHYGGLFIPYFIIVGPAMTTAYSILMTWVYNNTKSSLLLILLFHFSITSSAILLSQSGLSLTDSLRVSLMSAGIFWIIAATVIHMTGAKPVALKAGQD